jgi:type IV pilus assembly protein PilX
MGNSFALTELSPRRRQTGATLIVGLVLLLVLTVVGVSGMNTATMEITMAGNMQFQQDAFQAAEDAIDIAIGQRDYITDEDVPRTVAALGDPDFDRWSQTLYLCRTPVPRGGFSVDEFEAFHFETRASGRGPRNAPAAHVQGFYVVASKLASPGVCPL